MLETSRPIHPGVPARPLGRDVGRWLAGGAPRGPARGESLRPLGGGDQHRSRLHVRCQGGLMLIQKISEERLNALTYSCYIDYLGRRPHPMGTQRGPTSPSNEGHRRHQRILRCGCGRPVRTISAEHEPGHPRARAERSYRVPHPRQADLEKVSSDRAGAGGVPGAQVQAAGRPEHSWPGHELMNIDHLSMDR